MDRDVSGQVERSSMLCEEGMKAVIIVNTGQSIKPRKIHNIVRRSREALCQEYSRLLPTRLYDQTLEMSSHTACEGRYEVRVLCRHMLRWPQKVRRPCVQFGNNGRRAGRSVSVRDLRLTCREGDGRQTVARIAAQREAASVRMAALFSILQQDVERNVFPVFLAQALFGRD